MLKRFIAMTILFFDNFRDFIVSCICRLIKQGSFYTTYSIIIITTLHQPTYIK